MTQAVFSFSFISSTIFSIQSSFIILSWLKNNRNSPYAFSIPLLHPPQYPSFFLFEKILKKVFSLLNTFNNSNELSVELLSTVIISIFLYV